MTSLRRRHLHLPPEAPAAALEALRAQLGLPAPCARLLHTRGLRTPEVADAFLHPAEPPDPRGLPGMAEAVARLGRAAAGGEAVLVCGDYDCDGVCAAAAAVTGLRALGLTVRVHLPCRADGYGLRPETLPALAAAAGSRLVLAVDNGTTAGDAVAAAARAGVEVIIADHHQLGGELPAAVAVVNPRRDPQGPFADLAGVGVTWCLLRALAGALARPLPDLLDLVALGTVADVVPLRGINRWLVARGLAAMADRALRPGMRVLLAAAGVAGGAVPSARDLSHGAAPRLNAPGRLASPEPALELLLAPDEPRALAALATVEDSNRRRQQRLEELVAGAEEAAAALPPGSRAVVLADARWHPGLVGPAASRLAERLHVPVLLAGIDDRGVCRGSGRGPAGWDLTAALQGCAELLLRFGGHSQAAGFEVALERLDALRAALAELAPEPEAAPAAWELDGPLEAAAGDLSLEVAEACARLGPFGMGHPEPAFLLSAAIEGVRTIGRDGGHLRLQLRPADGPQAQAVPAVAFGLGPWGDGLATGGPFQLVVRPEVDRYRGREALQVSVLDLAPGRGGWGPFGAAVRSGLRRRHPDRDGLAAAFRRLRAIVRDSGVLPPEADLLRELARDCLPHPEAARAALVIFREVGLLDGEGRLQDPERGVKVNLGGSARFRAAEAARRAAEELLA